MPRAHWTMPCCSAPRSIERPDFAEVVRRYGMRRGISEPQPRGLASRLAHAAPLAQTSGNRVLDRALGVTGRMECCMVDILGLERACLTALPAPRQAFIGPFVVKGFLGGTGRANAASSQAPVRLADLSGTVARVEACFDGMDLPRRFRSTPLDPEGLLPCLQARGYVGQDESIVLAAPLPALAAPDAAVRDEGGPSEAWMALVGTAEYQVPARRAEKLRNPDLLAIPGAWLVLREDGVDAACLFAVADGP